jgi:hypothetical protein
MMHLHLHRGEARAPRGPVVKRQPAALFPPRRVLDHDAIPLGLYDAVKTKVGDLAAEHVRRVLTTFPQPDRRISRDHTVRLLAISSGDGRVTYIDRRTPDYIFAQRVGGGTGAMSPDRSLNEHEEIEWILMYHGGLTYVQAHPIATIAEHLVVESMGFVPSSYEEVMQSMVTFAKNADDDDPPPDPFLTWEDTQCTDDCDCAHCRGE